MSTGPDQETNHEESERTDQTFCSEDEELRESLFDRVSLDVKMPEHLYATVL